MSPGCAARLTDQGSGCGRIVAEGSLLENQGRALLLHAACDRKQYNQHRQECHRQQDQADAAFSGQPEICECRDRGLWVHRSSTGRSLLHNRRQLCVDLVSLMHSISLDDQQDCVPSQGDCCHHEAYESADTGPDARAQRSLGPASMVDSNNSHRSSGNPQDASRRQQRTQNTHAHRDQSSDLYRHFPGDEIARILCCCLRSGAGSGGRKLDIRLLSHIADLRRAALQTVIRFRFQRCAAAMTHGAHMLKLNYHGVRRNHVGRRWTPLAGAASISFDPDRAEAGVASCSERMCVSLSFERNVRGETLRAFRQPCFCSSLSGFYVATGSLPWKIWFHPM